MAANAAVSALLKPTAEHGRNAFPLDTKQVYSQKSGQIIPVKCFHFIPNDYFDMQISDFSLTFPMQTAPFLRGRKEFSVYSVYYNAVWSLFNQYQAGKNDDKTSVFGYRPKLVEPRISLFSLYMRCFHQWTYYMFYEHILPWVYSGGQPDWAQTGFLDAQFNNNYTYPSYNDGGSTTISFGVSSSDWSTNSVLRLTTPEFGYDNPSNMPASMITNGFVMKDIVGHFRVYNWVRKLDMLGYGNIYPILSHYERQIVNLLSITTSDWSTVSTQVNNYALVCAITLAQMCHTISSDSSSAIVKRVNVYPICAYNLVFYHFFRNSYYDTGYAPTNYNVDFIVTQEIPSGNATGMIPLYNFEYRFLDIEYHQWKKDTFTAVLPDTQFGAVSDVSISSSALININGSASLNGSTGSDFGRWSNYQSSEPLDGGVNVRTNASLANLVSDGSFPRNIEHTHSIDGTAQISSLATASFTGSFDVIALKRAELLQNYRQQMMRAGNKTSDVFRALYGSSVSSEHEDDIIPRFLDTFGEDIFVDPVTATANTGSENMNGQLGDIASRAKLNGQSQHIKFNAGGNFGCILVLSYVVPTAEYNSYMLDPHLKELTPQAHYIPQFDKFGLEPIYSDELNMLYPQNRLAVLGYGPAYHHKKSMVDQVHGAFCSFLSLLTRTDQHDIGTRNINYVGEFNNWVSPRTDMQSRTNTLIRDFYINPSVLDNVFVRAAGADIADDQFICNTFFDVKTTRMMSKVGLIDF